MRVAPTTGLQSRPDSPLRSRAFRMTSLDLAAADDAPPPERGSRPFSPCSGPGSHWSPGAARLPSACTSCGGPRVCATSSMRLKVCCFASVMLMARPAVGVVRWGGWLR